MTGDSGRHIPNGYSAQLSINVDILFAGLVDPEKRLDHHTPVFCRRFPVLFAEWGTESELPYDFSGIDTWGQGFNKRVSFELFNGFRGVLDELQLHVITSDSMGKVSIARQVHLPAFSG